ncbi:protease synthase and sporulation protein PAI 2 [mine drainage metagenome]|uniref:Protease synthase and sporulation protein PAI 2 n=1 Tax=mine drainage metagenome TaxID=410659 RepID=A0A1J5RQD9_9ZZZZ
MYNLSYFKENNADVVIDFMKQHSFAMLIGVDENNKPVATQVPLLLKQRDGDIILQGHIMKQTDHHKAFEKNKNALVVFSGAHTYVSASLYTNQQQASTWNYMSVHAKGELFFLDDEQLLNMLNELTSHYENNEASPALYKHLPEDYVRRLSKAIIAFEIKVDSLENVFKLSQNRDEKSFDNIVNNLQSGDAEQKAVAEEMQKRKDEIFHK